ncbi:MAG TPA: trypsin-like serine protease [Actinomycetes bacterium]|nr:trypsin-like serine protease [Actinomycetes bacterium]
MNLRKPALVGRIAAATVLFAGLAIAAPANAITNGTVDGNDHPNVGGMVHAKQYSDGTWLLCSGTLISPTVFLTAAHCGRTGKDVTVTFDADYVAGDAVYPGTFFRDPAYNHRESDPHDIAVIVLDSPIRSITPAQLPKANAMSHLSKNQRFTSVGVGAYEVTNEPGGHHYLYNDVRMEATGGLNAVNKAWLHLSMNPAKGDGGSCYGDSGGPNFLGNTDIIAGITITGDAICRATNVDYRVDTPAARHFLGDFVALP